MMPRVLLLLDSQSMSTRRGTKDRYHPQGGQQPTIFCDAFHGSSTDPLSEADRLPRKCRTLAAIRQAERPPVRLPKFSERVTLVLPANAGATIFPVDVHFQYRILRPSTSISRNCRKELGSVKLFAVRSSPERLRRVRKPAFPITHPPSVARLWREHFCIRASQRI